MGGSLPKPTRPLTTERSAAERAVPEDVPSIVELKKALPAHCFQPTVAKSMYFVLKDMLIIAVLYLIQIAVETNAPTPLLK